MAKLASSSQPKFIVRSQMVMALSKSVQLMTTVSWYWVNKDLLEQETHLDDKD
jgi:hypothetical protein